MAITRSDGLEYSDSVARATRVVVVDGGGTPPTPVQRTTAISRVNTATTTAITAGKQSFTVTVVAAASAASPTLDGVALPVGYTATFAITDPADTLESASLVTVAGDDVIILSVT